MDELLVQTLARIERKVDASLGKIADLQVTAARLGAQGEAHNVAATALVRRVQKVEEALGEIDGERKITKGRIAGFVAAWAAFTAVVSAIVTFLFK